MGRITYSWLGEAWGGLSSEGLLTVPTPLSLREVSRLSQALPVVAAALMMVTVVSSVGSALQQDTMEG